MALGRPACLLWCPSAELLLARPQSMPTSQVVQVHRQEEETTLPRTGFLEQSGVSLQKLGLQDLGANMSRN